MDFPSLKTYHKESYAAISPMLPEVRQEGKTILITGGSEGIGFAIAQAFIAASAKTIIIVSRHADKVNSAVAELTKQATSTGSPTVTEGRVCDVSSLESTEALWTGLQNDGIFIDVLVLNAAHVGVRKSLLENGRDGILHEYNVNFRGTLDFAEHLYKQKGGAGKRKV